MLTIHLKEAKYELQPKEGSPNPFLTITVPNSDKHVFTAETISEWHETLRHATKICKPQSPSLVFVPAGRKDTEKPPLVLNANEVPKGQPTGTQNGVAVYRDDPQARDQAIVAWVNFCCSKQAILSPGTTIDGMPQFTVVVF
jgi:hypothetical protein